MAEREHNKQVKKEEARLRRNAKARDKRAAAKAERQRLEQLENPLVTDGAVGGGFGGTIEPSDQGITGPTGGVWDIFFNTPGVSELGPSEEQIAREYYERGFIDRGVDPQTRREAREDYLNYMGVDDSQFDWSGWREEMGYE
jgi:hypothetical protein